VDYLIYGRKLAAELGFGGGFHQIIIPREKITKKISLRVELLAFLKKNNMAYDEKYL
jgi:hypothetical protein